METFSAVLAICAGNSPVTGACNVLYYCDSHLMHGWCLPCLMLLKCFPYDVITRKRFPHYLPFARGIHRWPVDSPLKGTSNAEFPLMSAWTNCWTNGKRQENWCLVAHWTSQSYEARLPYWLNHYVLEAPLDAMRRVNKESGNGLLPDGSQRN